MRKIGVAVGGGMVATVILVAAAWIEGRSSVPAFIATDQYPLRVFERDGRLWLWGGEDDSQHFDITDARLDLDGLYNGLGREWFNALIEPEYETVAVADETYRDVARVLAVTVGGETRLYPLATLMEYEVVNDVIGDVPIFAAYCYLAELGAVYDRRYDDHVLTFALSGYTYREPGVWDGERAFVLWDRDTESLWWPPAGKAMTGPLMDTPLRLLDEALWSQTSWGEAKVAFPEAMVLKAGQTMTPPASWPRLKLGEGATSNAIRRRDDHTNPVAPRWEHDG